MTDNNKLKQRGINLGGKDILTILRSYQLAGAKVTFHIPTLENFALNTMMINGNFQSAIFWHLSWWHDNTDGSSSLIGTHRDRLDFDGSKLSLTCDTRMLGKRVFEIATFE